MCIFFVRGRLYALQAACPHLGGALDQGDIEDFANAGSTDTYITLANGIMSPAFIFIRFEDGERVDIQV